MEPYEDARAAVDRPPDGDHHPPDEVGTLYQSRQRLLTPRDIRCKEFPLVGADQDGFDPREVGLFLHQVEVDLAVLYREIVDARDEAQYYREILQDWYREYGPPRDRRARHRRGNRRPSMWPPYSNAPRWEGLAPDRNRSGR